jgi:hypothetical protein
MAEQLKNILAFNLPPGGSVVIPHELMNAGGLPLEPDIIFLPDPNLVVTADDINITLTNSDGEVISGDVLVESWHTIERAFGGAQNTDLPVKPYVVVSAEGNGQPPQPPFNLTTVTIFARPTGSDVTGTGTLLNPFATMQRAVRDIPTNIPAGVRFTVDMTGCNEVLPPDYTLPAFKSGFTIDSFLVNDPDFQFVASVLIQAIPQLAPLPGTDAILNPADFTQAASSVSGLITLTLTGPPRASWGGNALKGFLIGDSVGNGNNTVIWSSTTTQLVLCASTPLVATLAIPVKIKVPGATIVGSSSSNVVAVGSARGALRAVNCDSIGFSGLHISNSGGPNAPGLALGGNGSMFAQMCWLSSPTLQAWSPALARTVRCWITGSPTFSNFVTVQQSLCDAWLGTPLRNIFWFLARASVFDGCVPLEPTSFVPGAPTIGEPALAMYFLNCAIGNTPGVTGDGIRLHGAKGQLTNCDIFNCGRDGIQMSVGSGLVELASVGTQLGGPNTRYGVFTTDGIFVQADAATATSVTPLNGTAGQTKVGGLAPQTWAAFVGGGSNTYDLPPNSASIAVATGARLYT